jgi:hypothetical protein
MFKGTTIEELISSVCRAEEHARLTHELEAQLQAEAMPQLWQQTQYRELIEVA